MLWGSKHRFVFLGISSVFLLLIFLYSLSSFFKTSFIPESVLGEPIVAGGNEAPITAKVLHLKTPEVVKALYMTACVAATPSRRTALKQLIETTELNAIVIDIKDATGVVSFLGEFPRAKEARGCIVGDLGQFIEELHESGIYVIGRISVFQDPSYTSLYPELAVKSASTGGVWKDKKGLSFIDVGAEPYWDYIIRLANESYELGFDEINFDYIRYPSDGNMQDAIFSWTKSVTLTSADTASTTSSQVRAATRTEILEQFFQYLHENLKDTGMVTSADLFGMTTTVESDMGIGQVLERALPYFDYISPMVYPSHYPPGWNSFANPAEYPYDVVKIAMSRAVEREMIWREVNGFATSSPSKMRPWLQDFNLGAIYSADKVRAQIEATYDSGLSSWMLWNAGNNYTATALLE